MAKSSIKREFSAGGVAYKHQGNDVVWLVGKHSGYHKWVLPKGLIEKGERGFETAVREVREEMGVQVKLVSEKPIHRVQYMYWANFKKQVTSNKKQVTRNQRRKTEEREQEVEDYFQSDEVKGRRRVAKYQEEGGEKVKVFKVVSFYLMEYESGDPQDHDWEMEEAGWFAYDEAIERLAFGGEREALRQAQDKLLEKASLAVARDKRDKIRSTES